MVFTFLKARGVNVGNSLVEDDQVDGWIDRCLKSLNHYIIGLLLIYSLALTQSLIHVSMHGFNLPLIISFIKFMHSIVYLLNLSINYFISV